MSENNGNPDGEMTETPTGTTVRDSNLLVIRGYSAAKGMDAGEYISSDEFTVGGHKWAICLYPAGNKAENKSDFVSVHVKLVSASKDVQARFELTLMDQTGKGKHKITNSGSNRSHPFTLRCRGSSWGFNRYFRRDMLEISDYLRDDCLKFYCTIEVTLPDPAPTPSIAETRRGSKLFVIQNYSVAKGHGKCVESDEFRAGAHKWVICFYPESKHDASHVAVFVKLASEGKDVKAMFELVLMDQTGKGNHMFLAVFDPSRPHTILHRGSTWGLKRFFERESLETSDYLRDDCLKIYCSVGVVSVTTWHPWIKVPESDFGSHLGKLLENKESCDVTFNISGEKFHAHKLILAARSPKLCSDLLQGMDAEEVTVPDMEPKVFKALLQFIYTGGLGENEENVGVAETLTAKLLAASDRYELKRLKTMCESRLRYYITEDPFQVFTLANRHHAEELRKICLKFAHHNPIGEKLTGRLLAAADQTEAKKLKRLMENRMCEYITVDSVAEILALAHRCHAAELKEHCLKFAAHNLTPDDVMRLEGFKHLEEKCPSLKSELLKTVAENGENSSRRIDQQTEEERKVDEVMDLEDSTWYLGGVFN